MINDNKSTLSVDSGKEHGLGKRFSSLALGAALLTTLYGAPAAAGVDKKIEFVKVENTSVQTLGLTKSGELWTKDGGYLSGGNGGWRFSMDEVKDIAATHEFAIALKKDRTVWISDNMDQWRPSVNNVTSIAAGHHHVLALTQTGELLGLGQGSQGQFGSTLRHANDWTLLADNVKKISAGGNHSMALKRDGTVWVAGDNAHGELGNPIQYETAPRVSRPSSNPLRVEVPVPRPLHQNTNASVHFGMRDLIKFATGQTETPVRMQGSGAARVLNDMQREMAHPDYGGGGQSSQEVPGWSKVAERAKDIAAGDEHSLIVLQDGRLLGAGSNTRNQLSDTEQQTYARWTVLFDQIDSAKATGFGSVVVPRNGNGLALATGVFPGSEGPESGASFRGWTPVDKRAAEMSTALFADSEAFFQGDNPVNFENRLDRFRNRTDFSMR